MGKSRRPPGFLKEGIAWAGPANPHRPRNRAAALTEAIGTRGTDMNDPTIHLGQPVGFPLPEWTPPPVPARQEMKGRYCRLEPMDANAHADALFAANAEDAAGRNWTYLPYGPFPSRESYRDWLERDCCGTDPLFFAIIDASHGVAAGVASYLRIAPAHGSIELGHLNFSPRLQRTAGATEALYLMTRRAFDLGYRRYEWKCNALNAPSRAAAQRLGFSFEGIFRQAAVVKGHNRDTAWYSIIDREWPALEQALSRWLHPSNFDEQGRQRVRLSALTAPLLAARA